MSIIVDEDKREERRTQRREAIQVYLREIGQIPLLTVQQEVELADRIKRGDKKARGEMIKANLRLVVKIAHDYEGLGLPLLDLVSEGNIGLMKAVERFDPKKGAKLSTYAAWWIKQAVRRALANQAKTIRLPVHVVAKVSRLHRASHQLTERLGREPSDAELADHLHVPAAKVAQLKTLGIHPASLDAPVSGEDGEDGTQFGELIEDVNADTPFELLRSTTLRQDLRQQIENLTPREAEVIRLRFGLDGEPPLTLEEVGHVFKVSRERVRQVQEMALTKLRRSLDKLDTPAHIARS